MLDNLEQALLKVLSAPRFWIAVIALVNILQQTYATVIPSTVMVGINGVIVAVVFVLTGQEVVQVRLNK